MITSKFSLREIHNFWTQKAMKQGQSPAASWSDQMAVEMEIREIIKHLIDGDRVLDVGCANGCSTIQLASKRHISVKGIDLVPEMIEQSRLQLDSLPDKLLGKVEFKVDDITALNEPREMYDKVVSIRVLINLGNWNRQLKALNECARVLKPKGTLLLSEATLQGWQKLNKFRREWGLPDLAMPPFNFYLDGEKVIKFTSSYFHLIKIIDFSSTYYIVKLILDSFINSI